MAESSAHKSSKKPLGKLATSYLVCYNFLQVLGWSYLLFLVTSYYITNPKSVTLWDHVKLAVYVFQNAAVLEIVHSALGLVKSSVVVTTFQVFSRVMVVCGVLMPTPTGPASPGLPIALLAWSITEIIRYLYYALNLLGGVPYILTWCRYTFFYALYPIGVTGELLCFYGAQKYVAENNMWNLEMPNRLNFIFSYHYFLLAVMLLYIPLFPQLYLHMCTQRRRILEGEKTSKKLKGR